MRRVGGVDGDGDPAPRRLADFGGFDVEEAGDGGAGEVDVEDADGVALQGEGEGELGCYAGFADAAFAGEDEGDVFDVGERHAIVCERSWLRERYWGCGCRHVAVFSCSTECILEVSCLVCHVQVDTFGMTSRVTSAGDRDGSIGAPCLHD